jgi:hypothetical protein
MYLGREKLLWDRNKLWNHKSVKEIDIKERKWDELLQNHGKKTVHLAK